MSSDSIIDFVAGWCSGGAAVLLCQPTDTILTRYQAGSKLLPSAAVAASTATSTCSGTTLGVSSITRSLIQQFGMTSLWRGSSAMIGAVPFQNALLMSGYGLGKRWGEHNQTLASTGTAMHPYYGVFLGGCTGGVVQSFLMSPVELIKVEQQVINKQLRQAARHVLGRSWLSTTTWRGLNATLLRDGVPHGMWFVSYEFCKEFMTSSSFTTMENGMEGESSARYDSVVVPLVSGAVAATVAWAVGYPADLIKTRIQAGGNKGIYETALELRNEPGGLYRGFALKLVRAVPASMIGFVTYEFVKGHLSE